MTRTTILLSLALIGACKKKPPEAPVAPAATETAPAAAGEGTETPAPAIKATPREQVDAAAALLTTGQEEQARKALDSLKALASQQPTWAEIPYDMGVAYEIVGDLTSARKYYLKATQVDSSLGQAWLNLGALAERDGDYVRALQNYQAGLKVAPENPDLVVAQIGVLRKMGRHPQAIAAAKEALKTNANNLNVYNNLGLVYLDQGKPALALFVYQRALDFIDGADNNALLHCNLGRVYSAQDKAGLARLEYERALKLDPKNISAMLFMANIDLDNRDWAAAAELLERARDLQPENPGIRQNLGIAYRGLGRFEDSKRSYEKALDLDPTNVDPYLDLAVLYGDHMKSYDLAIQALDKYQEMGGTKLDLAASWRDDIVKQKENATKAEERRKKQEERKKAQQEREHLAKEAEAREKAEAEEDARRAAEQKAADEDAARKAAEGGSAGGGTAAPTEGAASATSGSAPAAAGGSTSGLGTKCSTVGSCGSVRLECAHDGVCRDAGTPGTYGLGVGCMQEADCAIGLSCYSNLCTAMPQGAASWGGQPEEPKPAQPTEQPAQGGTDTPWGGQ